MNYGLDVFDVNPACSHVGSNQNANAAILERTQGTLALNLGHVTANRQRGEAIAREGFREFGGVRAASNENQDSVAVVMQQDVH